MSDVVNTGVYVFSAQIFDVLGRIVSAQRFSANGAANSPMQRTGSTANLLDARRAPPQHHPPSSISAITQAYAPPSGPPRHAVCAFRALSRAPRRYARAA